jgi:hypothetical protein
MFVFLEIIAPDIVFLSDIKDAVSGESSLFVGVGVERDFGDGCDGNKGSGIVFQERVEHIERQSPYSEIGKSARSVEKKNSLYGVSFGIGQKCRSKGIFYAITFEKMFILVVYYMNVVT